MKQQCKHVKLVHSFPLMTSFTIPSAQFEILLYKRHTVALEQRSPGPQDHVTNGYYGNEHTPEPDEEEDLLVEQV